MSIQPKKDGSSLNIRDFAALAGCSTATVSRVFSGKPGVSDKKRDKILELARRVGFSPNPIAQSLALQRSGILGLIAADLKDSYHVQFFRLFQQMVEGDGYQVMIVDSQLDQSRERQSVSTMRMQRAEGMVVFPIHDTDSSANLDHLLELKLARIPFVVVGNIQGYGFDCVASEEENCAALLARHLLELGHRRIAFVGHDAANRRSRERRAGVERAMAERGAELTVVPAGDDWDHRMVNLVRTPGGPTALIMAGCRYGMLSYRVLAGAGIRIPQDVSVAAFGDECWAQHLVPSLTTTREDLVEVARLATQLLTQRPADLQAPQLRLVPQEVMIRESTAPPAA